MEKANPREQLPELAKMFPQHGVPDHQILLSFNGDSDAVAFYDWWGERGEKAFAKWLETRPED